MYLRRALEPTLQQALRSFPAVILTGSRQAGKTTLLKHQLGSSYSYVLLDELDKRALATQDPRGFFERYPPPVIVDEIQHVPSLLNYIKARIEENRKPGQWVLTGSQQFTMMRNVSESLAGRAAVLHLHPLAIGECFKHLSKMRDSFPGYVHQLLPIASKSADIPKPSLGRWLLNGCYPELWQKKNLPRSLWYASYVQTYLDRDVRGNIKEANLLEFQRFLKLLASRTGTELHLAGISGELGISLPTLRSWVSLLEASSLVFLLPPYHKNYGKRIVKSPKIYFMDTGLVSYLVGLQTAEHLLQSPMAGALFETAMVTNFKKVLDIQASPECLYFWRAISGIEVDLLIDLAGTLYPVEMKLTSTVTPQHSSALLNWRRLSRSRLPGLVISNSPWQGRLGEGVSHCPWWVL